MSAEAVLRAAGVRRALIPVPVPVPPTNAWVIGEGEVTMVDAGALYGDAEARLSAVLAPGERVKQLVITHGHPDHHGAAAWLAARNGCEAFCHPFDAPSVRAFGGTIQRRFELWAAAARENGAPAALVDRMGAHYKRIASMGADLPGVRPLEGGARVDAGGRTLEVLHLPGHTAGSLALLDRKNRILFSGDTVLPGITPNPFFDGISDHPSGPGPFLASVRALRDLDVRLVLPGHGEPLTNLTEVVDSYERHHAERRGLITKRLAARAPATAFEIVESLFPGASALDQWLAFAEVFGHLQYMETLGQVERLAAHGGTAWCNSK